MRLAVVQHDAQTGDWQRNLARLEESMQLAAGQRVDVLLSPELYLTGAEPRAVVKNFGPDAIRGLHEAVESLANSYGVALGYSLPEYGAGRPRVASYFVDEQGQRLARYARVHLFTAAEHQNFDPGDEPPAVFEYLHTRFALSAGYDVQFAENVRAAAIDGAKILLVPAAAHRATATLAVKMLPTRALENGIYLLWANHCSVQGGIPMTGRSTIIGPDGQNIELAGTGPQMILADLDRLRQQAIRKESPYLDQRRPEVYHKNSGPPPQTA